MTTPSTPQPQPANPVTAAPSTPSANSAAESTQQESAHAMPQCRSALNAAGAPTPQPGLCEPLSEPAAPASSKITAEVHSAEASSTPSTATHTETPAAPAIVDSAIAATAAPRKTPSASKTPRRVAPTYFSCCFLTISIRSLCKIEWSKNVGGSNSEFTAYWKSLKGTEEEKVRSIHAEIYPLTDVTIVTI